jgi:ubiquinone/menaquinone biosynthesis C-methylase UbiE
LIEGADSTENSPDTKYPVVSLVSCPVDNRPEDSTRLYGKLPLKIRTGSLAFEIYKKRRVDEVFNCNYELSPEYRTILEKSGLRVSGVSNDGSTRIVEMPGHNMYLATGFLPQCNSEEGKPHPLIVAWIQAGLKFRNLQLGIGEKPETLDGRWDILYRDYPKVYDEFALVPQTGRKWIDIVREIVELRKKTVADIGSGSGQSTFRLAKYAGLIIGIEPEEAMTKLAIERAEQTGLNNVEFRKGSAFNIPLEDKLVDITVSSTGAFYFDTESIRRFVTEAERITRPGGCIVLDNPHPNWYGGELSSVILGKGYREKMADTTLTRLGFKHKDYYTKLEFSTVEKAIRTYGFIFGRKAIDYLKTNNKTSVKYKMRVYYKRV